MPVHIEGGKNISQLQLNQEKWRFDPREYWHVSVSVRMRAPYKQSFLLQRHTLPKAVL